MVSKFTMVSNFEKGEPCINWHIKAINLLPQYPYKKDRVSKKSLVKGKTIKKPVLPVGFSDCHDTQMCFQSCRLQRKSAEAGGDEANQNLEDYKSEASGNSAVMICWFLLMRGKKYLS